MPGVELSIIILNYNTFSLTCECIQSIYDTTQGVAFEIILVDNASAESDADLFKLKFPELVLVRSATNVGFAKGNNLGIEKAAGEYILLLNSDILLTENAVNKCLSAMKSDSNIGVIAPKLIYPNGKPQGVANRFPSILNQILILTRVFKLFSSKTKERIFLGEHILHDRILEADWVMGAFFLTKREAIDKLENKKLNDDYFLYFEDVEWCYDMRKAGFSIVYYPFTQAVHHGSASFAWAKSNDKGLDKISLIAKNEGIFLRKKKGWLYQKTYSFFWALIYLSVWNLKLVGLNLRGVFGLEAGCEIEKQLASQQSIRCNDVN